MRGEPVTITVEGVANSLKPVEFDIFAKPTEGKLLDDAPIPTGAKNGARTVATIRYLPEEGKVAKEDSFQFRVKVKGEPPSTPATVKIRIRDRMAKVVLPLPVEFGRVAVGETATADFKVANQGDGVWTATVPAPEGTTWAMPAGGKFTIAPGAAADCRLTWAPVRPGDLKTVIQFTPGLPLSVTGFGLAPFTAGNERVTLSWDRNARLRKGSLTIQNNRKATLELNVRGGEKFGVPAVLTLKPSEALPVVFTLTELKSKVEQPVTFSGSGSESSVTIAAAPAPAALEVSPPGIDFGSPAATTFDQEARTLTVRNVGGIFGEVSFSQPAHFIVTGLPKENRLEPGMELILTIRPERLIAAENQSKLRVTMDRETVEVPLRCDVSKEAMDSRPVSTGPMLPGTGTASPMLANPFNLTEDKALRLRRDGLVKFSGQQDLNVPVVEAVQMIEHGQRDSIVEWDGQAEYNYEIFILGMQPMPDAPPVKIWSRGDPKHFTVTRTGNRLRGTFSGLEPGTMVPFRIMSVSQDGTRGRLSNEWKLWAKMEEKKPWLWYVLFAALGLGIAGWIYQHWKKDIKWQG